MGVPQDLECCAVQARATGSQHRDVSANRSGLVSINPIRPPAPPPVPAQAHKQQVSLTFIPIAAVSKGFKDLEVSDAASRLRSL